MFIYGTWRKHASALVLGVTMVMTGTATAQTQWGGSSTPDELRYRLDILDAELQDIRARLGGTAGTSAPLPAPSGAGNPQLEAELQRLTAQVERMQNQINLIQQDLTNRLGDLEFRLTELEGGDVSAIGTPAPVGGELVGAVPETTLNSGTQLSAVDVSVSERGDIERAIQDVNQGRFDQAEDRLRQFMTRYPQSPLTGDAWYWLGESQAVRGIHAEAARSYLNGYNYDRRGARAAHNLFRLGQTLGRLGQVNEACLTLREVRNQYPNDPDGLVGRADAEADNLSCG